MILRLFAAPPVLFFCVQSSRSNMPRKGKHHPGHHEKHKKEEKEAEEDPELEEAPSGKPPSWIVRVFHRDLHGGYKRRNAVAIMSMAVRTRSTVYDPTR